MNPKPPAIQGHEFAFLPVAKLSAGCPCVLGNECL